MNPAKSTDVPEMTVGEEYLEALFNDDVNAQDSSYWFTCPPGEGVGGLGVGWRGTAWAARGWGAWGRGGGARHGRGG